MISKIHGRNIVGSHILLRLGLAGLILILLLAGSVGQAYSADSQQSPPEYYFSLTRPPLKKGYLCIGEKIDIQVRVVKAFKGREKNLMGFPVTALVTGGTGTVTPDKGWLGWLLDVPQGFEFTFEAKKSGHEKIFFETTLPRKVSRGAKDKYIEHSIEFDVKECQAKVNLIFDGQYSDDAFHASELALVEDAIIKQDDTGVYRGSADLEWNVFNHALNDGSCVYRPYTVISPAEIIAQPDNKKENLGLTLTYADVQHSVTVTCTDSGTTTVDSASLLSTLGPTTATVPDSGGLVRFEQAWPAEFGTFTIIVEPEEAKPSVSRTRNQVTWLLDRFETALFFPGLGQ